MAGVLVVGRHGKNLQDPPPSPAEELLDGSPKKKKDKKVRSGRSFSEALESAKKQESSPLWSPRKKDGDTSAPRRKSSATSRALHKISVSTKKEGDAPSRKASESRFLPVALRSPGAILRRKKPLGPSLSWDPERRSRSSSTTSRSRVHSDGSEDPAEEGDKLEMESECLHCSLAAALKRRQLQTEIESAVLRLARRLGNGAGAWPRATEERRAMGTPDIVVQTPDTDDEDTPDRQTSSERGSSLHTSETRLASNPRI